MIYVIFSVFTVAILAFAFYQWQFFMIFSPTYIKDRTICKKCEYLSIKSDDGIELEGVLYEPLNAVNTMLVFVGRGHDAVALIDKLSQTYPTVRIITFNYRGYGKSQGVVSEKNLLKDGVKIANIVEKHYGKFYILGFSLGSNVASYVALKLDVKGLFLVGAFDSIKSLSNQKYPFLHYLFKFFRYEFPTDEYVKNIKIKTYLFSSQDDEIVPIFNARKLKDKIYNLVEYVELKGLNHHELLWSESVSNKINKVIKNG